MRISYFKTGELTAVLGNKHRSATQELSQWSPMRGIRQAIDNWSGCMHLVSKVLFGDS